MILAVDDDMHCPRLHREPRSSSDIGHGDGRKRNAHTAYAETLSRAGPKDMRWIECEGALS